MPEPPLPDKVVAIDHALDAAGIRHAFGGALALAYYAEPRATIDIDVNVFVPPAQLDEVADALRLMGVGGDVDQRSVDREGQCRLWWNTTPIDVFFAYNPVHRAMERSARRVPFGDVDIPILSAEHLVVFKTLFARPKDWVDIEQVIITHPAIGRGEILGWVHRLIGPDDDRGRRLEEMMRSLLGPATDQPSDG